MSSSSSSLFRRALRGIVCCVSVLMLAASPALAADDGGFEMPRGLERVGSLAVKTADLLVVRPISLGYFAGGMLGWMIGTAVIFTTRKAPYAALYDDPDQTGYADEMLDNFVRIPGAFVFQRELGDFSVNGLGPG